MDRRPFAVIFAVGAVAALVGRALVRPKPSSPPAPPAASATSSPPPAGPAVQVSVYDDGKPAADRWVVFHDGAGGVVASARTGRDGKASGPMTSGGMVTVAHGTSVEHLVTITHVDPGDRLVVGEEEDEGGPGTAVCTALVSLPGRHPSAASHRVSLGVNATDVAEPDKPIRTSVLKRFLAGGRFQVLAEAIDGSGEPTAFAHAWFDGCVEDAGAVPAKLPPWSKDYRAFDLELSSSEHDAASVSAVFSIPLGGPGDRWKRGRRDAKLAGGRRATLRFAAPRPLGTRAAYEVELEYEGTKDRRVIEETRRAMPETVRIDLREQLLPRVTDVVVDDPGAARPAVRFRLASAPDTVTRADVAVVRLSWPETLEHVWTIVAPPAGAIRIAAPALPDALAGWRPDGRAMTAAAALLDASFFDGYADVKRRGLDALEDPPDAEVTTVRWSASGDLEF